MCGAGHRKDRMTEREARIAFNMIPTIGSVTVARLAAEAGGSVAEAYARYPDKRDWEGKEPEWEREILLGSVFCANCGEGEFSSGYAIRQGEWGIVIEGVCAKCGGRIARVREEG